MNSSIIITTYNSSKTIKPVIENFFKILDHNDELIIVDDGSIDNTKNIIKKYNDKRLKLFESTHIGRAKALNLGVKIPQDRLSSLMTQMIFQMN